MTRLTDQYPQLADALRGALNERSLSRLDSPIDDESNAAMLAWIEGVREDGHLEIGGQHSRTGNPVTILATDDELAVIWPAEMEG